MRKIYTLWFTCAMATFIGACSIAGPNNSQSKLEGDDPSPSVRIVTESLPAAQIKSPYGTALEATGGTAPYVWSLASGSFPPGVALNSTIGTITGAPTEGGQFPVTLGLRDSSKPPRAVTRTFVMTVAASPTQNPTAQLTITTTSLPSGAMSDAYSSTLTAANGVAPYTWSVTSGEVPPGLDFQTSGQISGTPSKAGTFPFSAEVKDSSGATATGSFSISIAASSPLHIATNSLPSAQVESSYAAVLGASGGTVPYSWSLTNGSWPRGITLNTASGAIGGAPTEEGQFPITVSVRDSSTPTQTATQILMLTVTAVHIEVTTTSLPSGAVSVAYNSSLAAANGVAPYSWSVTSGKVPPGLSVHTAGQISGTPSQSGTFSFAVQAKDSSGSTATASLSINIAAPSTPVVSSLSPSSGPISGGTTVTIKGSNFSSGATVSFGGTAATSVTVSNSSQILAVAPSHVAGTVGVIVQADGQSSTSSSSFTYNALTPTVSSVSPNSGPAAGGTTVTISGSNFLAGALVLFGAVPAPGVAVVSSTQIHVVTPASVAGAVSVTVENPGNLASKLASGFTYATSSTGSLTVSGVSPSSGPVGTQVTITGTNFESGATVVFGSTSATSVTFSSSTQLVASVPAVNDGTYNITVTDPDPGSATLAKGFTVTASPASTPSAPSGPVGNQGLLSGMTPGTLKMPAGWTLAATQDFETSALPSGQAINAGASISCSFSHSGSCSESSVISFDGAATQWYFGQGQLTGREFYLSFWDYAKGALFNTEYVLGHIIKTGIGTAGCGGANNMVSCPGAGQEELGLDTLVGDYCGTFNCASPPSVTGMQGNFISASNTQFNGSKATNYGSTGWNQWEFWFRANTPGQSDGFERVYLNGRLFNDYENVSFFGNVDMTGMQVEAGGWYTKNVWTSNGQAPPAGKCSSGPGIGQEVTGSNGGKPFAFYGSQCAPTAPTFTRYIDDIILLEK